MWWKGIEGKQPVTHIQTRIHKVALITQNNDIFFHCPQEDLPKYHMNMQISFNTTSMSAMVAAHFCLKWALQNKMFLLEINGKKRFMAAVNGHTNLIHCIPAWVCGFRFFWTKKANLQVFSTYAPGESVTQNINACNTRSLSDIYLNL